MGFFFIIDYLVSFIVLLVIKAPWWAWIIYIGSALFWFVVLIIRNSRVDYKTTSKHNEDENIATFHCSDCGNDFEALRHVTREAFDDDNKTVTLTYFPTKCPKCGNWATTPKTTKEYKVSSAEAKTF